MNLSDAIKLFLGEYIETTRETYRQSLQPMSEFIGNSRPIETINKIHMLEWSNHLRTYMKEDGKRYADATIHKHIKTARVFFNWCVKTGFMEQSPASVVKQQKLVRGVDRDDAMSDEEYQKLLDYFRDRARYMGKMQRNLAMHLFMGDTGCRSGGAGSAKWEDIDLEEKTAVLVEKGNKRNVYYFGDECANQLKKWKYHKDNKSLIYAFGTENGALSTDSIRSLYYRACQKIGIRILAGHSMRHRKGFQLAESGVPLTTGQLVFNHESPRSTEVYYPRSRRLAEQASRRLAYKSTESPNILPFEQKRRTP